MFQLSREFWNLTTQRVCNLRACKVYAFDTRNISRARRFGIQVKARPLTTGDFLDFKDESESQREGPSRVWKTRNGDWRWR